MAKEDGESFHLRAASEVEANGGLKSFAIERRRNHSSLSSQGVAGSRPAEEQPVDLTRLPKIRRNYFEVAPNTFQEISENPCLCSCMLYLLSIPQSLNLIEIRLLRYL